MAQTYIPPFPNLRNGDDVNYTECFDIAREERIAGMTVDPNDSNQNPKTNPPPHHHGENKSEGHRPVKASTRPDPQHYKDKVDDGSSRQKSSKAGSRGGPSPLHPAHESKPSRKDGANPPAERYPTHNSHHQQHKDQRDDGSSHRRPSKASSRGPSPLHPAHESKSLRSDRPNLSQREFRRWRGSILREEVGENMQEAKAMNLEEDHYAIHRSYFDEITRVARAAP
ncbi:hypothetical protein ACMD2_11876 [Ananas comosus]|uniref:Uncharacterized protein n=1 Tax=Ananas comosus TaxID=4615 RepID=A0A199UW63_ANACO|nr:hypothetical protein ACMD2_11876 [Ananas comosus]